MYISKGQSILLTQCFSCPVWEMLSGIPDGSLPDSLMSIVKAPYLEKLEVQIMIIVKIISILLVKGHLN